MLAEGLFNRHAARDFDWTLAFAFILRSAFVALFHFFRCTQRDKNVLQFRTLLLARVHNTREFQQFGLRHKYIEVRLALVLLHLRIQRAANVGEMTDQLVSRFESLHLCAG